MWKVNDLCYHLEMRIITLLLLALLGCNSGDGSNITIQGVVLEADGRTGIPRVLVTVEDSGKVELTNDKGGFKFEDHPFFSYFNITVENEDFKRTFTIGEVPVDRKVVKLVFKKRGSTLILDDVDFLIDN
jgi:hypothetical protein